MMPDIKVLLQLRHDMCGFSILARKYDFPG
jgi:hypothetical protein